MRALKVLVVVMGVLIVAGTVTLVALVVQRAGQIGGGGASGSGTAGTAPPELALNQPPGTRIHGLAAVGGGERGGGLLAVWVGRPDGSERILLVDPRRGQVQGEIRPDGTAGTGGG